MKEEKSAKQIYSEKIAKILGVLFGVSLFLIMSYIFILDNGYGNVFVGLIIAFIIAFLFYRLSYLFFRGFFSFKWIPYFLGFIVISAIIIYFLMRAGK